MKACTSNHKSLSLLAINALEPRQAEELQAHVATCPECRRYLQEMSNVAGKLTLATVAASEIEATEGFHQKLARRIEAEGRPGIWAAARAFLRSGVPDWRVAAPVVGVVVVVIAVLIALGPHQGRQIVPRVIGPMVSKVESAKDLTPSFGSYRMLADRSLEALDQELTKEAEDEGSPGAPIYTTLSMARAIAAD
ncbi:MAG TPA: zf-HC2 domain-containing protein [Verrucomicrobiae bacterium]|nr:zf-HC2 domain-containing protein [Verrucomicrobiae bacterium]